MKTGVKRRFYSFNEWIDYIFSEVEKTKISIDKNNNKQINTITNKN